MRLLVTTPTAMIADAEEVREVRAEDATGAFGIWPGHADFVTRLAICVVSWKDRSGQEHYVAVRNGVLAVKGGQLVNIATRDARAGDDLSELRTDILAHFRSIDRAEEEMRRTANRLHAAAIRQLQRVIDAARRPVASQAMPRFGPGSAGVGGDRAGGPDE